MIGGIGDGTFAIFMTIAIALVLCLAGYWVAPSAVVGLVVALIVLPLIVYGLILTAPRKDQSSDALSSATRHTSPYREQPMLPSDETAFDTYLPVRLVVVILAGLSVLGGVGAHVGLILLEPPYKVPRMRCLREQLEEAHPTWYK